MYYPQRKKNCIPGTNSYREDCTPDLDRQLFQTRMHENIRACTEYQKVNKSQCISQARTKSVGPRRTDGRLHPGNLLSSARLFFFLFLPSHRASFWRRQISRKSASSRWRPSFPVRNGGCDHEGSRHVASQEALGSVVCGQEKKFLSRWPLIVDICIGRDKVEFTFATSWLSEK